MAPPSLSAPRAANASALPVPMSSTRFSPALGARRLACWSFLPVKSAAAIARFSAPDSALSSAAAWPASAAPSASGTTTTPDFGATAFANAISSIPNPCHETANNHNITVRLGQCGTGVYTMVHGRFRTS